MAEYRFQLEQTSRIAVVGAGIIGVCAAIELVEAGFDVSLFDQASPGTFGPSYANAGQIAVPDILPLASPGIALTGLAMWLKPDGGLNIPLRNLPEVLPWLYRFWRASSRPAYARGVAGLAWLNNQVETSTQELYRRAGIADKLTHTGALFLYETERSFAANQAGWHIKAEHGIDYRIVDPDELTELEPDLASVFAKAVRVSSGRGVCDPYHIVQELFSYAQRCGVEFIQEAVTGVVPTSAGATIETRRSGGAEFDVAVIACGIWSRDLAKRIGDKLPLVTERGYNTTFANSGIKISQLLVFSDRSFVASPLEAGLRIGGWDELGGHNRPADHRRTKRIERLGKKFFPNLNLEGGTRWMGARPSTPDSLPIIGPSAHSHRIVYACGHGHYGLTQAVVTGQLVRQYFQGTVPDELQLLSPARFA